MFSADLLGVSQWKGWLSNQYFALLSSIQRGENALCQLNTHLKCQIYIYIYSWATACQLKNTTNHTQLCLALPRNKTMDKYFFGQPRKREKSSNHTHTRWRKKHKLSIFYWLKIDNSLLNGWKKKITANKCFQVFCYNRYETELKAK